MITHGCLRLRHFASSLPAGHRRARGRRLRSTELGCGLPRLESLEDRTLLAGSPIVTTLAATGITTTGATLNGTVNPNGTSTDSSFQYSTSPSLSPNVVTTFAGTAGTAGSADGTGTAALFNLPYGVAVDPTTGNVYVGDGGNDTIRMITPAGVVTTLAGTAGTVGSADGTGAAASFDDPTGVAYDPTTGDLFVADAGNDTIRMITSAGVVTTFAGTAGTVGSADGTGAAASFDDPHGVAVDPTTGNVYVADTGNDTIRMITPAGVVTTLAGTAGTVGSADGTGAAASFDVPTRVAVDATGNLYVADAGNDTIRMITPAGVVTTFAGTAGTVGSADGTGAAASFDDPIGVAVDPTTGNVYVTDSGNETIRMITPAGVVTTLAGTAGTSGSADGTGAAASFDDPTGVAFDPTTDTLFVADSFNDTIRSLSPPTAAAQAGLTGTTAQAMNATLTGLLPATTYYFRAVATSAAGTTDGAILSFTTTTTAIAPTATTQAATSITSTGATLNGSVNPNGTSTDTSFQYSTSPSLSPNVVTTFAGTAGTAGSADGTGAAALFNEPDGTAVDPTTGNVYVADSSNDTIRMITPAGVVTTFAGTAGTVGSADGTGAAASFDLPTGVAYDPTTGDLYVADADNDTIRMITSAGVVTTFAGTAGTVGSADGTGPAASFDHPHGVAVDPTTGNVYVADSVNDTIRMITPAGVVTTLAGTAGTSGSANGTGAAASFDDPTDVAYDPTTGDLFVADAGNDTIRMITSAGVVTTLAGTAGTVGSADGTGAAASFDLPIGVAVDPTTGNVYVTDSDNDTIRMITPAGVVTTLAGTAGTAGSADGTGAAASFDAPSGGAFDPTTDTLFVTDSLNDTIRSLSPPTATAQAGLTGTTAQAVNAALTGLLPATTYYFRAVATSAAGTTDGAILSFTTTTAIAPTATTQAATSVTGTAATLNGTVNPEGLATTADFVYGTSPTLTTGTTTIPIPALAVGSGTSAVAVTEPLSALLPSTTYYFQVEATNSAGTTDGGILSFTTAAIAPAATTQAATSVTGTTATLNGTVNPEGLATTADFVYGTSPTLTTGTTTIPIPPLMIASGTSAVAVTEPLSGLLPSTTYYFQIEATNSAGTTNGGILSFTTTTSTVTKPVLTVGQATNVTTTGATVNGTVNPNGVATSVYFVYGTQPTLTSGTSNTAQQSIGSGTAAVAVTAALTGLTPGTTYYFEPAAISNGVTTLGPIQSFTTTATTTGLSVTNLQRFGYHDQTTEFVLTFNEALDSTSAQNVNNYQIVNSQTGSPISIASAVYDSTNDTVTLTTVNRVYLYGQYQLTVTGTSPSGVSSSTGVFLSGAGAGQPGTNYVQSFGESILAGPNLDPPMSRATRVRILRTWKHEEALAARIAARIDKAAERRTAALSRAHRDTVVAKSHPVAIAVPAPATSATAAIDAVLGDIIVPPKTSKTGRS